MGLQTTVLNDSTNQVSVHTLEQQLLSGGQALAAGKRYSLRAKRTRQPDVHKPNMPAAKRGTKKRRSPQQTQSDAAPEQGKKKKKKPRTTSPPNLKPLSAEGLRKAELMGGLVAQEQSYRYPPGQEPFRAHAKAKLKVNMDPLLGAAQCRLVSERRAHYHEHFHMEVPKEQARVLRRRAEWVEGDKAATARPDTKCLEVLKDKKLVSPKAERVWGHTPGIPIGHRFSSRAELLALGGHRQAMAGISYLKLKRPLPGGCQEIAESVVIAGGYADDQDDGKSVTYTGQGGNDMLGNSKQTAAQTLRLGNLGLVGNIHTGIPVRAFRKFEDGKDTYFIYDGLYHVVAWWTREGADKHIVIQFSLERIAGQASLHDRLVMFVGGGHKTSNAERVRQQREKHPPVLADWTQGLGNIKVAVVNQHDSELPPRVVAGVPKAGELRYLQETQRGPGVPAPAPAVVPTKLKSNPHAYIRQLNRGELPYVQTGASSAPQLVKVQGVVHECGPWTGCKDCQAGSLCVQAASQRPMQHKLELYKTHGRGWGLRALQSIESHTFVCAYTGLMLPKAAAESEGADSNYVFDCGKRDDFLSDGSRCRDGETDPNHESLYEVDAASMGNIARFVNHSCDANLFVQPVLAGHHDVMQARICFFAARKITLYEELTLDYGAAHVATLPQCCCGAAQCVKPHALA